MHSNTFGVHVFFVPDINECAVERGNCDEHSDCVNQDGAEQLCKCQKGWTGNNDKPGVACRGAMKSSHGSSLELRLSQRKIASTSSVLISCI